MPTWVSYCLRIVVWASVTIGVSHGEWLPSFSLKFLANYVKNKCLLRSRLFSCGYGIGLAASALRNQKIPSLSYPVKTNVCFAAACFPADMIHYTRKRAGRQVELLRKNRRKSKMKGRKERKPGGKAEFLQ